MLNKVSFVTIIIAGTLLISWLVIQLWPVTVIKANVQPYQVVTKKVKAGGQLVYIVDACKFINAISTVSRTIADGIRYPSIQSLNNVPTGCTKTHVSVLVPNYVVPGVYHLELNVAYKINSFRTDTYKFETEDFEVTK